MIYGSVCSGIESASLAWEPLGWRAAWFAEIEPFPSAVLAYRWPAVANMGDMCKLPGLIDAGLIAAPDVLVGGTPCQAFSVAGMRKGLADDRGQLTIKFVEVANAIDRKRPGAIIVWENVPGVLSDKTNAFGCFLAALVGENDPLEPPGKKWGNAGIVYGPQRVAAWRILDAQYFGVAQRRRRVFVVASSRDGFDPGQVLFEFEGVRRDTPPSREEGPVVAALTAGGVGTCGADDNQAQAGHLVTTGLNEGETARALTSSNTATGRLDPNEQTFVVACLDASYGKLQGASGQDLNHGHSHLVVHGTQDPIILEDKAFPLGRNGGQENVVAFTASERSNSYAWERPVYPTIGAQVPNDTSNLQYGIRIGMQVRRLTPRECERLQGEPDDHTKIPWRGKQPDDCPDGPRYKSIGNSKAIPVIRWLGERIAAACS